MNILNNSSSKSDKIDSSAILYDEGQKRWEEMVSEITPEITNYSNINKDKIDKKEIESALDIEALKDSSLARAQRGNIFDWVKKVSNFYLMAVFFVFLLNAFKIRDDLDFGNLVNFLIYLFGVASLGSISHFLIKKFFSKDLYYSKLLKANWRIFYFIICIIIFIIISLIFDIREGEKRLSDSIMIALITSTTATIIGLPALIINSLFPKDKDIKTRNSIGQ